MGRTEINENEGRVQVGPQEEQRFRVRTETGMFTKVRCVRDGNVTKRSLDLFQ